MENNLDENGGRVALRALARALALEPPQVLVECVRTVARPKAFYRVSVQPAVPSPLDGI